MKIKQHLLLTAILLLCSALNINAGIVTGKCGENVTYSLNTESGLLEIKGTGEMDTSMNPFWMNTSIKEVKIFDGVTSIGDYAFNSCSGLTSVTIPNSVTSIGFGAFYGCSGLTSVTIPNSVTSIGRGAFSGLTSISVDKGNPNYDSRDNCNAVIETSTNTLIAGSNKTVIPSSVTSIGEFAFENCKGLTSVTIPNSVTSIASSAFYGCSGLTSITIPASVKSIGVYAFSGCSGLKTVVCESADVPPGSNIGLGGYDGPSFVLYVPEESVAFYRSAEGWNSASAIKPIEEAMKEVTTWAAPKVTITEAGIKFASDVKDGEYVYSIKDAMLTSKVTTTNALIPIANAYILSVYVKKGYDKSPTTTVYIDKNMKTVMGSGDVNGDGKISMADANAIVNKYLGK